MDDTVPALGEAKMPMRTGSSCPLERIATWRYGLVTTLTADTVKLNVPALNRRSSTTRRQPARGDNTVFRHPVRC